MATAPPQYLDAVRKASTKYGVPAQLLAAQIQAESGWNPNARSPAGALGISQFMPATAKGFGIDPLDPFQAIDAQAKMMSRLLKSYGGDTIKALAAYNAGAGAVNKYGGVPPFRETQNYVKTVQAAMSQYPSLASSTTSPTPSAPTSFQPIPQLKIDTSSLVASRAKSQRALGAAKPGREITIQLNAPVVPKIPASHGGPAASQAVQLARQYLGTKYTYGGESPQTGFDCSGFAQYVYGHFGVKLPRVAADQFKVGTPVDLNHLQPGDLVFFRNAEGIHHEGIYIGNGAFLHAPHTGDVVKISKLTGTYAQEFAGGRRVT